MKKLKSLILNILLKRGYTLIKTEKLERITKYFYRVMDIDRNNNYDSSVSSIVFSKDRAMQLNAFIESYFDKVQTPGNLYVLYKCTNERHLRSYKELIFSHLNKNIIFFEEYNFKEDLIQIVNNSNSKTIGLFVDDMIFVDRVDYNNIAQIDTFKNILVLSRGKDLDYSVPLDKEIELPEFYLSPTGYNSFYWDYINEFSDWTFPVGISGYFYGNSELRVMLRYVSYKSPNTLENALNYYYYELFVKRIGLCPDFISCPCIHANIVQNDSVNPIIDTHSINELLNEWELGNKIDLNHFYGKKGSEAQFMKYSFIKR